MMPHASGTAAGKLWEIARDGAVTAEASQLLGELATALDGGDPEPWAAVDLRAAFNAETALKPPSSSLWLNRSLEILVFAPVASTWLGLMVATSAYKATLNDPALKGQNFLQRWQAGFDGRIWGGLSFDRVAEITFTLVAVIMVLAVAHFAFRARAEDGWRARAYRRLSSALTEAEKELAPVRLGAVGRVAAEVGKVSAEVAATAEEIRKVGLTAKDAQEAAGNSIDRITGTLAAVHAAAADVAQAVVDMGDKLADATAATSAVADTEAEFAEKLIDATGRLDTTVAGIADQLRLAVASGQTQLSRSVADSSERVADSLSEGALRVRDAIGELKATAARSADEMGTAVKSLAEVKDATLKLPSSLGSLDAEVTRLHAVIDRLAHSVDAMKVPVRPASTVGLGPPAARALAPLPPPGRRASRGPLAWLLWWRR